MNLFIICETSNLFSKKCEVFHIGNISLNMWNVLKYGLIKKLKPFKNYEIWNFFFKHFEIFEIIWNVKNLKVFKMKHICKRCWNFLKHGNLQLLKLFSTFETWNFWKKNLNLFLFWNKHNVDYWTNKTII